MKITSIIAAMAMFCSMPSMAQVMVKDYMFTHPETGGEASNFNFIQIEFNADVISGSTEDWGANTDFHLTRRDANGNILWDMVYDFSSEDFLSAVVPMDNNLFAAIGTVSSGSLMEGKVLIIDGNSGNVVNETVLKSSTKDLYLLGADYHPGLDNFVVAGFVSSATGNMLTSSKESYVAALDGGLGTIWENNYNSGTTGSEMYNMFSKAKYVDINGGEEIYLTGSQSHPELIYGETQAVTSMLLDANTGATTWDKPFIANFNGHMTFGVDVLENGGTNELILLCQETETHNSFVTLIKNNGTVSAGHHFWLNSNINHFGRDLEWMDYGSTFVIGGYENHASSGYKAYMIEVDANLTMGFNVLGKEHLIHDLYNYDLATTNVVFKPYTGLGALRPFIFNSEFMVRHSGNYQMYLLTARHPNAPSVPYHTRLWRTPIVGALTDCTDTIPLTDTLLYYTYVLDMQSATNAITNVSDGYYEVDQPFMEDLICGQEMPRMMANVIEELTAEVIEEGLYLESLSEDLNLDIVITDIIGNKIYEDNILLEGEALIPLDRLKNNTIYFIEVNNEKTGESVVLKTIQ